MKKFLVTIIVVGLALVAVPRPVMATTPTYIMVAFADRVDCDLQVRQEMQKEYGLTFIGHYGLAVGKTWGSAGVDCRTAPVSGEWILHRQNATLYTKSGGKAISGMLSDQRIVAFKVGDHVVEDDGRIWSVAGDRACLNWVFNGILGFQVCP